MISHWILCSLFRLLILLFKPLFSTSILSFITVTISWTALPALFLVLLHFFFITVRFYTKNWCYNFFNGFHYSMNSSSHSWEIAPKLVILTPSFCLSSHICYSSTLWCTLQLFWYLNVPGNSSSQMFVPLNGTYFILFFYQDYLGLSFNLDLQLEWQLATKTRLRNVMYRPTASSILQ